MAMGDVKLESISEEPRQEESHPLLVLEKEYSAVNVKGINSGCCNRNNEKVVITVEVDPTVNSVENNNSLDIADAMLDAVLSNNTSRIIELEKKINKNHIDHKYGNYNRKTIVVIACTEQTVEPSTLRTLFTSIKNRLGKVDSVDESWYGWEPIHYAAQVKDPEKMRIVTEFTDVNALTYFSDNALHILLENKKIVIYGNLCNDLKSTPCCLISEMSHDALECTNILLKRRINATHSNFWNETPISLALKYRYHKFMEQVLDEYPYINMEGGGKYEENLRDFQDLMNIGPFSEDFYQEPAMSLFNYLKANDVESFLSYMNGNIREYVNVVDGADEMNTSGTMLQLCFRKVFIEYIQDDQYNVKLNDDDCDIMDTPMLDVFCSSGMRRCINHLLDNDADPNKRTRKFGETLLEAAAVRGHYPLVVMLLQHKWSKTNPDDIFEILPKLFRPKKKLVNHDIYRKFVLNVLLNKLLTLQSAAPFSEDKRRVLNETLVELNLSNSVNKVNDSENIYQLLRLGASLLYRNGSGKTVVEQLDCETLRTHFEDCIDNEVFHYDSIVEDFKNSYSETMALVYLVNDKKKNHLLTTPVLTVLIHEKWFRTKRLFYLNLLFYFLFVFSIYGFVVLDTSGRDNHWIDGLFYLCLFFHTVKELIQLLLYWEKYFLDLNNYIEILVLVLCVICIFAPNAYVNTLVILSSTVILFLFLIEVPKFTKFTFILGSLKYFFQYACFYFIPFMSFAIGLNILFPHPYAKNNSTLQDETFQNFSQSDNDQQSDISYFGQLMTHLFEALILFTGEFNERVLQPKYYPVFGRIFMALFILCITIVLNNLLVGLIVSDLDRIEKETRIYKRIKMTNFIIRINASINQIRKLKAMNCIEKFLKNYNMFEKGTVKIIKLNEATREHFDERNKKRLEELQKLKWTLYDENVLKKVHEEICGEEKD